MDISILYTLGSVALALGIILLIVVLKRNKVIKDNDLKNIIPLAIISNDLFFKLVGDLNLKQEKQILKIGKIINQTLEYVEYIGFNNDLTYTAARNYAYNRCIDFDIELTEERKRIINELLNIGIKSVVKMQ